MSLMASPQPVTAANQDEEAESTADKQPPDSDEKSSDAEQDNASTPDVAKTIPDLPTLKPRFQLMIPSLASLSAAVDKSKMGYFVDHLAHVLSEMQSESSDGLASTELRAVWESIADWPDASVELAVFAPDRDGQPRWALRLGLPVGQVHDLLQDLLSRDSLSEFFGGVALTGESEQFRLMLDDQTLATLVSGETNKSVVASHNELPLPSQFFSGADGDGPVLLTAQLDLTNTEKDSGGTFLSKFNVVQSVDYTLRPTDDGNWQGEFRVNWPPVAGLALKAMLGRTKQTFFVPPEAFGGVVLNVSGTKAMLEQFAGFGDAGPGPIQSHAQDEVCITILPGTGFLPAPDIVAQCRLDDPDEFVSDLETLITKATKQAGRKDLPPAWKSAEVGGRKVFWRNSSANTGILMPLTMRPVIFIQQATDQRERERDFLIIAWTSTNPKKFVERWIDYPRGEHPRFLPSERSVNSEAWVHWQQIYDRTIPYLNPSLYSLSRSAILLDDLGESIPDGQVIIRLKYEGLRIETRGPVPLGMMSLPTMISFSGQESLKSDLGRERLACRRLKVLYHHSKLFRQDIGRWPAEVAELDGYIDFAGNPQLLKLSVSPKKRLTERFRGFFKSSERKNQDDDDEAQGEDEDDLYAGIDDSIYVVNWGREKWTLGIAEGTLDHLKELFIDQDGVLHRVEKVVAKSVATDESATSDETETK